MGLRDLGIQGLSKEAYNRHPSALVESDKIGSGTRIWAFAHILEGAVIGKDCNIGDHCYIGLAIEGFRN